MTVGLIDLLAGLVHEMRAAGLPVSMTEHVDAAKALSHVPLDDRASLKHALGSTLVKSRDHWPIFDTVFETWFSPLPGSVPPGGDERADGADGSGTAGDEPVASSDERHEAVGDLDALLRLALAGGDQGLARAVAREAVRRFGGMGAGRPVGPAYYLYRTLRGLDLDGTLARMVGENGRAGREAGEPTTLERRLEADDLAAAADAVRREVEAEVRRRLVAERGAPAVSRAARRPAPADVDVVHATGEELAAMSRAVQPLARRLAVRLERRRHRRRGPLHFRDTIRHSMSSGGVPLEPRFRHRRPARPELIVLADVSGSVAAFARFTLQFVHALGSQFSRVRSFVFVDGVDEVTRCFEGGADLAAAVAGVDASAGAVSIDGHSDYGQALEAFWDRWGDEITPRTTVIVLGDARGNYHPSGADVLADVRRRARHLYWLNPEPGPHWDTGDSVMSDYARHCDGVFECRSLRHLERFVDHLG